MSKVNLKKNHKFYEYISKLDLDVVEKEQIKKLITKDSLQENIKFFFQTLENFIQFEDKLFLEENSLLKYLFVVTIKKYGLGSVLEKLLPQSIIHTKHSKLNPINWLLWVFNKLVWSEVNVRPEVSNDQDFVDAIHQIKMIANSNYFADANFVSDVDWQRSVKVIMHRIAKPYIKEALNKADTSKKDAALSEFGVKSSATKNVPPPPPPPPPYASLARTSALDDKSNGILKDTLRLQDNALRMSATPESLIQDKLNIACGGQNNLRPLVVAGDSVVITSSSSYATNNTPALQKEKTNTTLLEQIRQKQEKFGEKKQKSAAIKVSLRNIENWKKEVNEQINLFKYKLELENETAEKNEVAMCEENDDLQKFFSEIKKTELKKLTSLEGQLEVINLIEQLYNKISELQLKINKYEEIRQQLADKFPYLQKTDDKKENKKNILRKERKLYILTKQISGLDKNLKAKLKENDLFSTILAKLEAKLQVLFEIKNKLAESIDVSDSKSKLEQINKSLANLEGVVERDNKLNLFEKVLKRAEVINFSSSENDQFSSDNSGWDTDENKLQAIPVVHKDFSDSDAKKEDQDAYVRNQLFYSEAKKNIVVSAISGNSITYK